MSLSRFTCLAMMLACRSRTEDVVCESDDDCLVGHRCDTDTKRCIDGSEGEAEGEALGKACENSSECASAFCVDQVCCESRCADLCLVCDGAGRCAPAPKGTDPRGDCAGSVEECAGDCDGEGSCSFPTNAVSCGKEDCEDDLATQEGTCDGLGGCDVAEPVACSPYICGEAQCLATCSSSDDCELESLCDRRSEACIAAELVESLDCNAEPAALSEAILACEGACYFRVSGMCEPIAVSEKDIYVEGHIDGATIVGDFGTAAITVMESLGGGETRVALANLDVAFATGLAPGIDASGLSTDSVEIALFEVDVTANGGAGVSASASSLSILQSTIQSNGGAGVSASNDACSTCTTTIDRTQLLENDDGGLKVSEGDLIVRNSILAANGLTVDSEFGGAKLVGPFTSSLFAHNTVAENGFNSDDGVLCLSATVPVVNSLVWGNESGEVIGCGTTLTGSHLEGVTEAQQCGSAADPVLDVDFHLDGASPCIDAAPDCADLAIDVDGDARPSGDACDVGADESP